MTTMFTTEFMGIPSYFICDQKVMSIKSGGIDRRQTGMSIARAKTTLNNVLKNNSKYLTKK